MGVRGQAGWRSPSALPRGLSEISFQGPQPPPARGRRTGRGGRGGLKQPSRAKGPPHTPPLPQPHPGPSPCRSSSPRNRPAGSKFLGCPRGMSGKGGGQGGTLKVPLSLAANLSYSSWIFWGAGKGEAGERRSQNIRFQDAQADCLLAEGQGGARGGGARNC